MTPEELEIAVKQNRELISKIVGILEQMNNCWEVQDQLNNTNIKRVKEIENIINENIRWRIIK